MARFVQKKEVLGERAGLGRALKAASRDRELSVWLQAESAFPHCCRCCRLRKSGEEKRGEGGAAARARAAGCGRSRSPRSRSAETKPRGRGFSAPPLLPARGELRSGTSGNPGGAAGTSRLRCRPARALRRSLALRAPATPGVAWVGYPSSDGLLFSASPNLLRTANSIKIKPRERFF